MRLRVALYSHPHMLDNAAQSSLLSAVHLTSESSQSAPYTIPTAWSTTHGPLAITPDTDTTAGSPFFGFGSAKTLAASVRTAWGTTLDHHMCTNHAYTQATKYSVLTVPLGSNSHVPSNVLDAAASSWAVLPPGDVPTKHLARNAALMYRFSAVIVTAEAYRTASPMLHSGSEKNPNHTLTSHPHPDAAHCVSGSESGHIVYMLREQIWPKYAGMPANAKSHNRTMGDCKSGFFRTI